MTDIEVTDRDKHLIRLAAKGQVYSLEQAHSLYWHKADGSLADKKTAQARLAVLVQAGYLCTGYTSVRKPGEQIYWLTISGAGLLTRVEQDRAIIGRPSPYEMRQQLDAIDARIKLESLLATRNATLLDWTGERELRSEQSSAIKAKVHDLGRLLTQDELNEMPHIPDAEALIKDVSGPIYRLAIEIDGAYFGSMLRSKIVGLSRQADTTGVRVCWATAAGKVRQANLQRAINEAGAQANIWLLSL